MDIDDQIAGEAIQTIFSSPMSQLTIYGFSVVEGDKEKAVCLHHEGACVNMEDKDEFFRSFVFAYKLNNALWNKVFDLSIIKKHSLSFNESIKIGEDFLFSLSYYKHIDSICLYPYSIYRYYIHAGSAMKSKNVSVFSYQQEIAKTVKLLYHETLDAVTLQQFLLMQLVCGINQSKERGVAKKILKQYVKNYMQEVMEGKRFSRQVVNNFLNSEGAGFLSKLKFKLKYVQYYK